jgi:hypothetical protein
MLVTIVLASQARSVSEVHGLLCIAFIRHHSTVFCDMLVRALEPMSMIAPAIISFFINYSIACCFVLADLWGIKVKPLSLNKIPGL